MLRVILFAIVGYLSGSVLFANLSARLFHKDILTKSKDHNPGTANAFMQGGFFCGIVSLIAIFLNLGRGPIVVEKDLADALEQGSIAAAGLDVLCVEPMQEENPLRRIKDSNRLIITPHIAWASVEARTRLMQIIEGQIREFFA